MDDEDLFLQDEDRIYELVGHRKGLIDQKDDLVVVKKREKKESERQKQWVRGYLVSTLVMVVREEAYYLAVLVGFAFYAWALNNWSECKKKVRSGRIVILRTRFRVLESMTYLLKLVVCLFESQVVHQQSLIEMCSVSIAIRRVVGGR